jgi:DNA-directed RNA polymerase subunit RPC12/RpoP
MKSEPRDRHHCAECRRRFAAVYLQLDADEPPRTVRVSCPHCAPLNRALVASRAAIASTDRAEKIGV